MPTPKGLPKVGEVWEVKPYGQAEHTYRFVVMERSRGDYFSMRVYAPSRQPRLLLMVDPAYQLRHGWMKYIGPAGPETKRKLGLT